MIRLTLLLLAGLFGAMLVFGEETPDLAAKRIDETVLDPGTQSAAAPQAEAESPQPVTEPVVVAEEEKIAPAVEVAVSEALETPVVEAVVETTKQETLDLTQPASFDGLIVVESTDSSADAAQAVAEELTATSPIEDEPATETPPRLYYVTGSSVELAALRSALDGAEPATREVRVIGAPTGTLRQLDEDTQAFEVFELVRLAD